MVTEGENATDPNAPVRRVRVRSISAEELPEIGSFLHEHLDTTISAQRWTANLLAPWHEGESSHGVQLRDGERLVGVYAAYYSPERLTSGGPRRFCNLAAWAVLEEYRSQGLLLIMTLLKQQGLVYTDLTADRPEVAKMDRRLGFRDLDVRPYLAVNVPWPSLQRVRILTREWEIEPALSGAAARHYAHHRAIPGLHHFAVMVGNRACHVAYRRRLLPLRRLGGRSLPVARILHVSDRDVFHVASTAITWHLLRRGIPLTWSEEHVTGTRLRFARPDVVLASTRLYRGGVLPDDIDYLYSEVMFG